ncbi:acetyl esterase [Microlunatus sagamiharensis]|uniref:Acetyl esterase n=1 Tax=Microlunatus sagamiharensis TaxID=546874 RepID=A0A1H2M8Q7_9ACTN|nr:alpha/beta hydrolase [Microlunatus sagamiharensis]SDU89502.1 acetyl esterase [Microlunatus sagamiharensis]
MLTSLNRRLPRPDPPPEAYLRRIRRELPRPLARAVLGPVDRGVRLVDRVLPTEPVAVPVRVYRPRRTTAVLPLVVNLHGGGFVLGNLTGADWFCGHLATMADVVVVSVDYRLAPEHPAPAASEDALAATSWLLADAGRTASLLGADVARTAVVGESAGGNLAALVALALRDRLAAQALLYPATDMTMTSASVLELADAPVLPKTSIDWFGRQYLPQGLPHSIAPDDPRVSPVHAPDHAGLPPTLVVAAGLDPLRDDALRYSAVLQAAGVDVRTVLYPRAVHGFMAIPRFEDAAAQALDEVVAHLRGRLTTHP